MSVQNTGKIIIINKYIKNSLNPRNITWLCMQRCVGLVFLHLWLSVLCIWRGEQQHWRKREMERRMNSN